MHGLTIGRRRRLKLIIVDGFLVFGCLKSIILDQYSAFQTTHHWHNNLGACPRKNNYSYYQADDNSQSQNEIG